MYKLFISYMATFTSCCGKLDNGGTIVATFVTLRAIVDDTRGLEVGRGIFFFCSCVELCTNVTGEEPCRPALTAECSAFASTFTFVVELLALLPVIRVRAAELRFLNTRAISGSAGRCTSCMHPSRRNRCTFESKATRAVVPSDQGVRGFE